MTHTTDAERQAFEAVASDDGKWPQAIERDAKGNYLLLTTAHGWMWWQAARRAPAEPVISEAQVLAITTAYEQGVGKGHQSHTRKEAITNPYGDEWGCDSAWQMGYDEGREQAERKAAVKARGPAPIFHPDAQKNLEHLQRKGFNVVGHALEHSNPWTDNRRCTVDYTGLVRWMPSTDQEVAAERAGVEQRRALHEAVLEAREACAKVCEGFPANRDWVPGSLWGNIRSEMSAAIRARQ